MQVANLVYAGIKSSHCFSDHFLIQAEKESAISTSRRFHAVKLGSDELFSFPLVIMTGEGDFQLPDARARRTCAASSSAAGFLLASAGCSSQRVGPLVPPRMAAASSPSTRSQPIGMDHPLFHTVYDIKELQAKHGKPQPLEGITRRRPARRHLFAGRPERHRPHAGLLLLRRQRDHQRHPGQRQHPGLRAGLLMTPGPAIRC